MAERLFAVITAGLGHFLVIAFQILKFLCRYYGSPTVICGTLIYTMVLLFYYIHIPRHLNGTGMYAIKYIIYCIYPTTIVIVLSYYVLW